MKRKRRLRRPAGLIVTQEAIEDFAGLTPAERLEWLDRMRAFLSKTLSKRAKKIFESR